MNDPVLRRLVGKLMRMKARLDRDWEKQEHAVRRVERTRERLWEREAQYDAARAAFTEALRAEINGTSVPDRPVPPA